MALFVENPPTAKGVGNQTPNLEARQNRRTDSINEANRQGEVPSVQCYLTDPPREFDEPGQELGRDAQIWKTYVKETDTLDAEKVDGWKQTSDIILIFAALFSAISTAFVIESYKSLKPDPADVSVELLRTMSRTLLTIANQSQSFDPPAPGPDVESSFTPSWSSVCVNLLWFLSLSISVLASLIAMLAKEWCFRFMSGRTGLPVAQARQRQQKWDGLVKWKMEEILTLLPSLINLALMLFAIGLSIFLWDLHLSIAIPVTFVIGVGVLIYVLCTLAPFIDMYCPYGTTLSRLYQQLFSIKLQPSQDDPELDLVTGRAIEWMLNYCETPHSVEVAFRSAAGVTSDFDFSGIEKCEAWSVMADRFLDTQSYGARPNLAVPRWTSSLLRWGLYRHRMSEQYYQPSPNHETLEAMIWAMQARIDRLHGLGAERSSMVSIPTALSETAHYCVKGLHRRRPQRDQLGNSGKTGHFTEYDYLPYTCYPIEDVTARLESYLNTTQDELPSTPDFEALCTSFTLLICCSLIDASPPTAAGYLRRLIRTAHGPQSVEVQLSVVAFIISRHDFPGWSQPTQGNQYLRVQRALEVYHHYQKVKSVKSSVSDVILTGWLILLSTSQLYGLQNEDAQRIGRQVSTIAAFEDIGDPIFTFPPNYDVYQHIIQTLSRDCSRAIEFTPNNPILVRAHMTALYGAWIFANPLESWKPITVELYALILDAFHIQKDFEYTYAVLHDNPFPRLSTSLDTHLHKRGIVPQLLRMLATMSAQQFELKIVSVAHSWLLIVISSPSSQEKTKTRAALDQELLEPHGIWRDYQELKQVANMLKDRLAQLLEQASPVQLQCCHEAIRYGYRVMECMLEVDGCLPGDPRVDTVNKWLAGVPRRLRGLSSFVTLPQGYVE